MIYITQLIYIRDGREDVFDEFESHAIPIISKYNGELIFRIRPADEAVIDASAEKPYEIRLVKFQSESDFREFMTDEERQKFLYLKEQSIKESFLTKGKEL